MTDARDPRDLVEDYAMGWLDEADRAEFERLLGTDATLRSELMATLDTLAALGTAGPVAPPAALKDRVMRQVTASAPTQVRQIRPIWRSRSTVWLGAALAASLALALKLAIQVRDLHQDALRSGAGLATARAALAERDSIIAQLTDSSVTMVTLAATAPSRPAMRAYMNRARHTVLLSAANLEPLRPGRAYQLWFFVGPTPVASVTFKPDSAGRALVREIPMPKGDVAATAVTDEPERGSVSPTGKPLFFGKLATE